MARVRVILAVTAACVLASAGLVAHSAAEGGRPTSTAGQEVVRAQRFELVDSDGRVRAVLGMVVPAATVTSFRIMDRDGNEIVVPRDGAVEGAPAWGGGEAPAISLFDEAGRIRARMWLGPEGTPYLEMMQADGTVILALPSEGRVKMLAR